MKRVLKENWKFLVCVLMILAVLFPMIYTIFYTLPSADDFSMAYGCSKDTILADSISHANRRYMNSSGLWIYMFAETLLNPIVHFELESFGIGIEMIILFLAFIIALCALIHTAMRRVLGIEKKEVAAAYILLFLFVFLNTNIYKEVFYWFVGSSYMMAMTMGLITMNLTITYFYGEKIGGGYSCFPWPVRWHVTFFKRRFFREWFTWCCGAALAIGRVNRYGGKLFRLCQCF